MSHRLITGISIWLVILGFTLAPVREARATTPSTVTLSCVANTRGPLKILTGFFRKGLSGTKISVSVRARKNDTTKKKAVEVSSLSGVASSFLIYFNPISLAGTCTQNYEFYGRFRVPVIGTIEASFGKWEVPGNYQ